MELSDLSLLNDFWKSLLLLLLCCLLNISSLLILLLRELSEEILDSLDLLLADLLEELNLFDDEEDELDAFPIFMSCSCLLIAAFIILDLLKEELELDELDDKAFLADSDAERNASVLEDDPPRATFASDCSLDEPDKDSDFELLLEEDLELLSDFELLLEAELLLLDSLDIPPAKGWDSLDELLCSETEDCELDALADSLWAEEEATLDALLAAVSDKFDVFRSLELKCSS